MHTLSLSHALPGSLSLPYSLRHNMNEAEKVAMRRFYALRWWERDNGFAGDVTPEEIQVWG